MSIKLGNVRQQVMWPPNHSEVCALVLLIIFKGVTSWQGNKQEKVKCIGIFCKTDVVFVIAWKEVTS